jgi:hypothetical protein
LSLTRCGVRSRLSFLTWTLKRTSARYCAERPAAAVGVDKVFGDLSLKRLRHGLT